MNTNYDSKINNFGLIRFTAASLVIISHSYYLLGRGEEEPLVRLSYFTNMGGIAVLVFFIVSGFLLARSWSHKPNVFQFIKNRTLRIFPALTVCYLLMIFIISPLITTLSRSQYFSDPMVWDYAKNMFLYLVPFRFWLPGVFESNFTRFVNGALWTLPIEFFTYLVFAILAAAGIFRTKVVLVAFWLGIALVLVLQDRFGIARDAIVLSMQLEHILFFGLSFLSGVLMYLYRNHVPASSVKTIAVCSLLIFCSILLHVTKPATVIVLPFLLVWFAFAKLPPVITRMNFLGDFSFGMYIWGWFIQQLIILYLGKNLSLYINIPLCLLLATGAGYISWNLIEKHALKFKTVSPG